MARRIDIELTSARDDGTWTWRAAGAREPKGVVEASKLPGTPTAGDVLRVEVEMGLDGTDITAVLPPKEKSKAPETLQLLGRELSDDELVTSKLVGKKGRRDRDFDDDRRGGGRGGRGGPGGRPGERGRGGPGARDGRPGGDRPGGGGPGGDRGRHPRDGASRGGPGGPGDRSGPRREGGGGAGGRGERPDRPRRRPVDEKPRPKRLRAQRNHRRAVLDTLEAHERPIADEVLRGGIPAVRQAVEKQNAAARAEGRPEVDAAQLEALAERLLPRLRAAEWRDRADAALADIDELDLRDLRTVVVAADSAAKDDEAKAIAGQLREGLERRIEADHAAWLAEMGTLLDDGRVVRALRVSSRPPKAGAPLPAELATRLTESASASLTADTFADRWETVLDALSLSPVHARVGPQSIPAEPSDELKATVAGFGERVPLVAQAFGVEPTAAPRRPRRGGPPRGGKGAGTGGAAPKGGGARSPQGRKPVPPPPPTDAPAASEAAPAAESAPVGDADVAAEATEAPAPEETPATPEPAPEAAAPVEPVAEEAAAPEPEVPTEADAGDVTGTEAVAVEPAPAADPEPEAATEVPVEADAGDVTGTEAVEVAPSEDAADAAGADEV